MKKLKKFFKHFKLLRKKRREARMQPAASTIIINKKTDVLDADLIDGEVIETEKKEVRQFTKVIIIIILIFSCIWITWSYVLGTYALLVFQNTELLIQLSLKIGEVALGVIIAYCLKAFFETFAEKTISKFFDKDIQLPQINDDSDTSVG